MPRYDAHRIEPKWQAYWEEHGTFVTPNEPPAGARGKLYVLDMFPYPSGAGLHVGHPEGYTATDIVVRYSRMKGKHVLHPMGWDAFGLPAEQHAIKTGTHPRVTTNENIDNFRRQLKSLGFSYDWSREISTTDEDYYRWTQWIFLQLYDTWYDPDFEWTGPDGKKRKGKGRPIGELPIPAEVASRGRESPDGATSPAAAGAEGRVTHPGADAPGSPCDAVRRFQDSHRLAFQSEAAVNWCPALGTVLANEEVTADGKSEVGGFPVERRPLRQWMLRITAYAERLLGELDEVDWPESIKLLQRNWIGRSVGAEVDFFLVNPTDVRQGTQVGQLFESWKLERAEAGFPPQIDRRNQRVLRVYTTRPDTLFGATYMVISPEHPLVEYLTTPNQKEAVEEYCRQASLKSDLDRTDLAKEKSGVATGSWAINPVSGEQIPIWIADYVLSSYGTGAIMAVPAHDERDLEFAEKFHLAIKEVVAPPTADVPAIGFTGEGTAINSDTYNGLSTAEFKSKITSDLTAQGLACEAVNYRLRDWLFSRQRYWGEPFPIWHELDAEGKLTGLVRAVSEDELPVTLPEMEDFKPRGTPDPPLSWAPKEWLYATAKDGTRLKRETNSMPQWAGSCWYYLRFCDNRNVKKFIDPAVEKYWLPVDLYIGGAEHAVLHLLYSRFWHKVLFDRGHVSTAEPFRRLVNQGMILGEAEVTGYARRSEVGSRKSEGESTVVTVDDVPAGAWVSVRETQEQPGAGGEMVRIDRQSGQEVVAVRLEAEQVVKQGDALVLRHNPEIVVESRAFKMSKSRGNVINPDDVVSEYGADSLRLYEMFMGPLEQVKPWSMSGVEGVYRFLARVWRMFADERAAEVKLDAAVQDVPATDEQERLLHKTIKTVEGDIEKLSFNTAISRMMEFTNAFSAFNPRPRACLEPFVLLLAPFAPHLAEELWQLLGHKQSLAYAPWPVYDEAKLVESEIEIPVQVNGKLRGKVKVPAGATAATMQEIAQADATVQGQLAGKQIVKVVAVPGRMVNFVVKG
jgi:leucyl-tRNA synthetase